MPTNCVLARVQQWSSVHAELLWSYLGPVHPNGVDKHSVSQNLYGWLLLKGTCTCTSSGRSVVAKTGQWMFPPFGPRHQKFSPEARIISVSFLLHGPGGRSLFDHGAGIVATASEHPGLEKAARRGVSVIERKFPDASNQLFMKMATLPQHWELQAVFMDWLKAYTEAMEAEGAPPAWPELPSQRLGDAVLKVERHPFSQAFRESEIARAAGVSVPHLRRLFIKQLGKSPKERFEERRAKAAEQLVRETEKPLKAISVELGFSSPAHFSRWFSQRFKASPREARSSGKK